MIERYQEKKKKKQNLVCSIKESLSMVAESKIKQLPEIRYLLVLKHGIMLRAAFTRGQSLPALGCLGLFFKVLKARGMTSLFIKKKKKTPSLVICLICTCL